MGAPNKKKPAIRSGSGAELVTFGDTPNAYRSLPEQGTIRRQILDALRAGRRLTSREVWVEFGGSRLAADVHQLRRTGWPIVREEIRVECREGRSARVAGYLLIESARVAE